MTTSDEIKSTGLKAKEFYDAEIEKRQHAVAKTKGFAITDHALNLYAHCIRDPCPNRSVPKPGQE